MQPEQSKTDADNDWHLQLHSVCRGIGSGTSSETGNPRVLKLLSYRAAGCAYDLCTPSCLLQIICAVLRIVTRETKPAHVQCRCICSLNIFSLRLFEILAAEHTATKG